MTDSPDTLADTPVELRLTVDADPAAWLTGPLDGADDAGTEAWIAAAREACLSDFGLEPGSDEDTHLSTLLRLFAEAPVTGTYGFLRLRALDEAVAVARLHVGLRVDADASPLTDFDADRAWYDHEPQVVLLDEALGLRRATRLYVDDGVRTAIRLHRFVPGIDGAPGVDVVLTCTGSDLKTSGVVLPDLDALAASVWLLDAIGERR